MRRVLFVSHNHPMHRPGGAEIYAVELYEAVKASGACEPFLVARAGPPASPMNARHAESRFAVFGTDPNVYLMYTARDEIDMVYGTAPKKRMYARDWPHFLAAVCPDVVHFQHTLLLGYDLVRATRQALPAAPILYTLHDFLPICHHSGQMVRTQSMELCERADPRRCHQCFPSLSPDTFFLRERSIKAALAGVDLFIAPSRHLRDRYIDWGIEPHRVLLEDYGRLPMEQLSDPPDAGRRRRIGFFGQITRFKGVDVLLEAMRLLREDEEAVELWLHGANLEAQPAPFRERITDLIAQAGACVKVRGSYSQRDLPKLMADVDWIVVPSIWWENSPLVIQEARMSRRPVIASDVGGMAERVRHGVDGLCFAVGDPYSLSATIKRAISSPELWDSCCANAPAVPPMSDHVRRLTDRYTTLAQARSRSATVDSSRSGNGWRLGLQEVT
jgi:glycosyltransferase involved in cell wall biosynthesis